MRQSRQECWGLQQDLAAVREKLAGLRTTMEDRRKDVTSYKVQTTLKETEAKDCAVGCGPSVA